ncbi:hypothetical protein PoB_006463400 [Plakobranchus ocellatus]|uniref:C-type lectin domain-containing protein n=1 Tax=Plakobranchus ocellatus TaxID=259542 RepID=A0AAV4D1T5_9GAST|nr:hypothetical protein PoB_006463400 [Plakobranchus ocellatus]
MTEKKPNELGLKETNLERSVDKTIRQRQPVFRPHLQNKGLEHLAISGKIEGKRSRGRQRITFIDSLKSWAIGKGSNNNFMRLTGNEFEWRNMKASVCSRQVLQRQDVKKQYWDAEDECKKHKGLLAMLKIEKINQFLVDSLKEYKIKDPVFFDLDDIGHEA